MMAVEKYNKDTDNLSFSAIVNRNDNNNFCDEDNFKIDGPLAMIKYYCGTQNRLEAHKVAVTFW